uniref:Uncharacterized protein n=1 Tax=Rhizophora mucronata TaxID=61149 RepID=A0A2P2Q987_RHIMU
MLGPKDRSTPDLQSTSEEIILVR